ncbi:MAG: hypothetical protein WAT09_10690 [Paracoccaceae bacterium]
MPGEDTRCLLPAVLIVAAQPLVAQDIALTVSEEYPDAQIIVAASMDEAISAVAGFATIALAMIEAEEAAFGVSPLMAALTAKNARVCLIGARSGQRWPTLPMPFSTADLVMALHAVAPPP